MPAPLDDPELWEVFREEMTRHVRAVAGPRSDAAAWRAALHAMRGASAMMGLDELAAELSGLDEGLRAEVVRRLLKAGAPEAWSRMVAEVAELEASEETRVFGESLPPGLRLLG